MTRTLLAVLATTLLLVPQADARVTDAEWAKAKAQYRRDAKDLTKRSAAILKIGECDHPEGVKLLIELLGKRDKAYMGLIKQREGVLRELEAFLQKNAGKRVSIATKIALDKQLMDIDTRLSRLDKAVTSANGARFAAIEGLSKTKDTEALARLHTGVESKKWEVRSGVLQAMTLMGNPDSKPFARSAIPDKDPKVSACAIDCSAALADAEAVDAIIAQVGGKTWQLRASAVSALATFTTAKEPLLRAIGPLVAQLQKEDGRLQEDFEKTLNKITGYSFGGDAHAWKSWYDASQNKLAEVIKARAKSKAKAKAEGGTVSFYGIETRSKRLCFVIDISGSMRQKATKEAIPGEEKKDGPPALTGGSKGDPSRENDPDYPIDGTKMDVANYELKRAVKALPKDAKFNIVYFSTVVKVYSKKLVEATDARKKTTVKWIDLTLKPTLATNLFDALDTALKLDGVKLEKNYDKGIDTIFFLTDGKPTHGRIRETEKMLKEIADRNRLRKIKIHVIGVGKEEELDIDFLKKLAEQNGGTFVHRQ